MLVNLIEQTLLAISHLRRGQRPELRPVEVPGIPGGALILGEYSDKKGGHSEPFYVPPDLSSRHLLFAAGSGGGKTTAIETVIGQLIDQGQAFALIDARGDLADLALSSVARRLRPPELRGRLIWIDMRDAEFSVGFSPMAGLGDPYARAQSIGRLIRRHWGEFGPNVQLMADNTLALFSLLGEPLWSLDNFFRLPAYRRSVTERCPDVRIRRFFEDEFDELSPQKQQALVAAFMNKVNPWLGLPAIARMLSRDGISFARLLERRRDLVVICALGTDRNPSAALVGNLLFSAILEAGMRADLPERDRTPLKLVADEFAALVDTEGPAFSEVLREGRRFKLSLILGVQSLLNLPTDVRRAIRANVAVKLYGQNSAEECGEAAREIVSDFGGKDMAQALMSQQVGEMFAVVRGQKVSRQVKLSRTETSPVRDEELRAVKQEALRTYARPSSEVDRELLERDEAARSMGSKLAKGTRSVESPGRAVRHGGARGRFAPEETSE